MPQSAKLLIILLAAPILLYLCQASKEPALFDSAVNFQSLLACADTQLAQVCWKKHGQSVMSSVEPEFSTLARMVVRVCIQQTESQNLHDLHFLLGIQKCFHLGELIDLQPVYQMNENSRSGHKNSLTWQTLMVTFLFLYFVLHILTNAVPQLENFLILSKEFFSSILKGAVTSFQEIISNLRSSSVHKVNSSTQLEIQRVAATEGNSTLKKEAMTTLKKESPSESSYQEISCVTTGASQIHTSNKTQDFEISHIEQVRKRKVRNLSTTDVPDSKINEMDHFGSCEERGRDKKRQPNENRGSATWCSAQFNSDAQGSLEIPLELGPSLDSKSIHDSKLNGAHNDLTSPHAKKVLKTARNHSRITLLDGSSKSSRAHADDNGIKIDENKSSGFSEEPKPSFDISTESGRAKMRAYIEAKTGRKMPVKGSVNTGVQSRQPFCSNAHNQKMRRVFTSDRGWIWLAHNEANVKNHGKSI